MKTILICSLLIFIHTTHAKNLATLKASCEAATAQRDLDVNNVRTTILNAGDMWRNLSNARYEVPLVQPGQVSKHSLSAGALWFGGLTNENLRTACQTYRQSGNDFFPGPLTISTATISSADCRAYNRIWKVTLDEITRFKNDSRNWASPNDDFATWPAMGNTSIGQAQYLAPFVDKNGNGIYEVNKGEYPCFETNRTDNIPDMMLYWIYNDKGNIHSQTQGLPIGLEVQEFAFAYSTSDHLNNSTFYKATVINRGSETIDSFVVAQWTDGSIGNREDDYVQFDWNQQMMITYNGDEEDEGIVGYGFNPPSVGVVMLQGPKYDGIDLPLSNFIAYNSPLFTSSFPPLGPTRPEHYWSFMNGKWLNNTPITYGGTGKGGTDTAHFMFPGLTDPNGRSEWTENIAQNAPGDRCMVVSYSPFSLLPGAVNTIVYAAVWAQANLGGSLGSLPLLDEACNQAKALFQRNFIKTELQSVDGIHNNIALYPNPGTSEIHIDGAIEANSEISFFDMKGALVYTTKLQSSIDISHLKKGIYFYQLKDGQHQVIQTGKWLKN